MLSEIAPISNAPSVSIFDEDFYNQYLSEATDAEYWRKRFTSDILEVGDFNSVYKELFFSIYNENYNPSESDKEYTSVRTLPQSKDAKTVIENVNVQYTVDPEHSARDSVIDITYIYRNLSLRSLFDTGIPDISRVAFTGYIQEHSKTSLKDLLNSKVKKGDIDFVKNIEARIEVGDYFGLDILNMLLFIESHRDTINQSYDPTEVRSINTIEKKSSNFLLPLMKDSASDSEIYNQMCCLVYSVIGRGEVL